MKGGSDYISTIDYYYTRQVGNMIISWVIEINAGESLVYGKRAKSHLQRNL